MEATKNLNNWPFIHSRFSLPLFMVSRNRLKYTRLDELNKYIKKINHVHGACFASEVETASWQHVQHAVGEKKYFPSLTNFPGSKVQSKMSKQIFKYSWQLPPNRYDTSKIPYENKRGIGGALWPKVHTHKAKRRPNFRQLYYRFYSIPKLSETIFSPCFRAKGVFLSNPRERRATARCMVDHIGTCYKNPSDPGPATYNPPYNSFTAKYRKSKKSPNPHLFYRSSVVPVKKNSIHYMHTSFTGAPGRYEIRYPNICPCSSKLIYEPQIDLIIDKEKRKKFRRLSYKTIKARNYTSPDWRHVKGQGFRYLFKGAKPIQHKPISEQHDRKQKNFMLYADSKYIGMINNPLRSPLTLRPNSGLNLTPRIKFNCVEKKVIRKQLKSNKKIAFNSSQERFRDSYRLPVLTQKQQDQLKQLLPIERQFRDHPIMHKRPSEIKSKIYQTPKHMLPNFEPKLRKKLFKFQPLPQAKVLVTEMDTNINEVSKEGYYLQLLEAKNFFK